MDTSTTTFCRFSPLKTPKTKQKHKDSLIKFDVHDKEVSDTESLASVLTSDIHKLAKSVTNKLKKSSDLGMMSSDDDLFISQSKKVSSPVKSSKKGPVSECKSNSTTTDSSSDSDAETNKSLTSKKQKMVSPKKRGRNESGEYKPKKKLKSSMTSSQMFGSLGRKHNNHDNSESSAGSPSDTDSSKGRRGSTSSMDSRSSLEERNGESGSGSDEKSGSGTDRTSRGSGSENSDSETQSKAKKTTPSRSDRRSSLSESRKLRYEIPDSFEIGTSINYLSRSDIQGKQLWLITAPDDFDISTLHRQKIKLTGSSFITDENLQTDKQFEVVGGPFTRKMSNYCSASSQIPGSEDFVLGSKLTGQLQVMDWIPCMPKVELIVPHHVKHRVPDNLKPTFVPFGSESPRRDSEADCLADPKKEKHKKKKKDKKKK